jgi:tellurite resistance protein TehA-like permease
MTALSLFPFVTTVVTSGSGAIVADILPNAQHALWTIIVSYILWGTSMPFAMIIMVSYFQRLAVHKLPPREVIVSVFLPVGPPGQGGFTYVPILPYLLSISWLITEIPSIMELGRVAMRIFPLTSSLHPLAGPFLYIFGFITALILWGFGLVWLFFAVATIYKAKSFPFNMGWWGFTFPIGVFITSTNLLGRELPSRFFNVLGTVCPLILPKAKEQANTLHRSCQYA